MASTESKDSYIKSQKNCPKEKPKNNKIAQDYSGKYDLAGSEFKILSKL